MIKLTFWSINFSIQKIRIKSVSIGVFEVTNYGFIIEFPNLKMADPI